MPESESGTAMRTGLPAASSFDVPSGFTMCTLGFVYGVSLIRQSRRRMKSPYSFSVQRCLSPVASLSAS